jgi:hypothetical protein
MLLTNVTGFSVPFSRRNGAVDERVPRRVDPLPGRRQGRDRLEFEWGITEPPWETDFYYVRVIQEDYEMPWSSPIWISRP